jgi:hypothetical protein
MSEQEWMKHHYTLNISTSGAFRVDVPTYCETLPLNAMPIDSVDEGVYTIDPNDVFNPDWLERVNSVLPSPIVGAFAFKRIKERRSIHKDFIPPHRLFLYGLNFLIAPQKSKMTWYNTSAHVIDETLIPADKLLLVNTAQWHDADTGGQERWCVSLRPADCYYDAENPLDWSKIVENYKELIDNDAQ